MVIDRARVAGARCRDGRQGEEGGLGEQHLRGFTRLFPAGVTALGETRDREVCRFRDHLFTLLLLLYLCIATRPPSLSLA
jgi:hypothetical protein